MIRYDAMRQLLGLVHEEIVVCNLGHPSQELFQIEDRPRNFYMLGSMGLASSIGLGLALSTNEKVIVIDGDGAVLMNLGSLATIGANQPRNYVLVIIDNESHGSTGFQETFTGRGVRLDAVAKACNIKCTRLISDPATLQRDLVEVLGSNDGPHCVVIKVKKGKPEQLSPIPHTGPFLADRFVNAISSNITKRKAK